MKTLTNQATAKVITIIGILVIVAVAVVIATLDDRAGRPSLQMLAWLSNAASSVGAVLLLRPLATLDVIGGGLVMAVVGAAIVAWRRTSDRRTTAVLAATACAVAGQLFLLHRQVVGGALLYGLAVAAALGFCRFRHQDPQQDPPFNLREGLQLMAAIALASGLRFFALNRILSEFEGELAPYMVGATSLKGMLVANAGWFGPWAPLGLLYYLPIHLMTAIAGSTVLAVRLAPAAIGVLTVGAAYLLAREIAGRHAALVTAVILALDPLQIGWSRSDVHPHGVTTWPALLLAWATLRLIDTKKTAWFVAVAALMTLSWHQYPSGQMAVAVPIVALVVHGSTHRGFVRAVGWRFAVVGFGLAGWFVGYPVAHWLGSGQTGSLQGYLDNLGPRVAEVGVDSTASPVMHLLANTGNLISGIFVEIPIRHHQTFVPKVSTDLTDTSLPWFIAAFSVIGLCALIARLPAPPTVVTLTLIVTAAAPSVFSDAAFVKRAAVLYPGLGIVAAVGIVVVARALKSVFGTSATRAALALLVGGSVAWTCISCSQWFSGRQYDWGTPYELTIADEVRRHLVPETIVIADFWHNYMEGKMTYLLLDDLQSREVQPVAWYVNNPNADIWQLLEQQPLGAIGTLRTPPWYYRWSNLGDRLDQVLMQKNWRRVIYLMQDDADEDGIEDQRTRQRISRLREICPDARLHVLDLGDGTRHRFRLLVCDDHPGLRAP